MDAPGDARYGDVAVNDILIQFQQAPVFPNGTMNSSGWASIPPSGPVSPANVFAFHLQTEKNIGSTIFNTAPSTSMRASGWWNLLINVRQAIGLMLRFARQQKWVGRDHEGVTAIPEFSERGSGAIGVLKAGVAYE